MLSGYSFIRMSNYQEMMKSLIVLLCFHVMYAKLKNQDSIWLEISNGGPWGSWGSEERCIAGTWAVGFSLKIEEKLGNGYDDSSLNGIKLHCGYPNGMLTGQTIDSTVGQWGDWGEPNLCQKGQMLVSFKLQVEPWSKNSDDTAANGIRFMCREKNLDDEKNEIGHDGFWGTFGDWSNECPAHEAICGIKTKVEPNQCSGDDTALNDVMFNCCGINKCISCTDYEK